MTAPRHHLFTPDEYLGYEAHQQQRHEYVDGHVYAMTGASIAHNRVVRNLIGVLHATFRGRPCDTFANDMRVRVGDRDAYVYPDAVGLCGEPELEIDRELGVETLLNPSFVVEVLSPSTEAYDRGRKFSLYRRIPTLREYVLVAQDRMHAERYTPGPDRATEWTRADADGPDARIELPSVGAAVRLGDLYERVRLPERPAPLRRVREPEPAGW